MSKIEELKAAFEAASGGVWEESHCDGLLYGTDDEGDTYLVCDVVGDPDYAVNEQDAKNAKFIALAHNTMPTLLEAAELVRQARSLISEAVNEHIYDVDNGDVPGPDCRFMAFLKAAKTLQEKLK